MIWLGALVTLLVGVLLGWLMRVWLGERHEEPDDERDRNLCCICELRPSDGAPCGLEDICKDYKEDPWAFFSKMECQED